MKQKGGSQAGSDYAVGRKAGDMAKLIRWLDGGYSGFSSKSCRSATAPVADTHCRDPVSRKLPFNLTVCSAAKRRLES